MQTSLLWLKQDLRLDDNPALQAGLKSERLLPLYVIDPRTLSLGPMGTRRQGVHRTRLLLESLSALDDALRQRGSRLLVLQGEPERVIAQLVERLGVQEVLTHAEIAPEERALQRRVRDALGLVPLRECPGNALLHEAELPCPPEDLPQVFTRFRELCERRSRVFQAHAAPSALPALPDAALDLLQPLPTLAQLGLSEPPKVPASAFPFSGGEAAAQARLRDYLWNSQGVRQYKDTRNGLNGTEYSSKFSPWLANGCLSARRVVAELQRHESQYGRNDSTHWLWVELLWRDFFRWTLVRHGSALFKAGGLKGAARTPHNLDERFQHWCAGRTGMPFVDANMRELAATGFMSNRGRQVVVMRYPRLEQMPETWRPYLPVI